MSVFSSNRSFNYQFTYELLIMTKEKYFFIVIILNVYYLATILFIIAESLNCFLKFMIIKAKYLV